MQRSQAPIFVTGGAGFIGSHLVRRLVRDGHAVALLVRPTTDLTNLADVRESIQLCEGDLTDEVRVGGLLAELRPHGIFHLAVSTIMSGKTAPDAEVIRVNVGGTAALMNAANVLDYDFFIQTGSFLEYGTKDHAVREDELCAPGELYSITKLAATLYGQALARAKNKPILSFRVFTPYGPMSQKGRFVELMVSRALANEPLLLSKPEVTRDFIYVEDLVELLMEGMDRARQHAGEAFNAGTGIATPFGDLIPLVLEKAGSQSEVRWNAFSGAAYDSDCCRADMTKTFEAFSWRPKHALAEGLEKTIEWYRTKQSTNDRAINSN